MNIFVLDTDVKKCAEYHVDKHCVKMILETTQLLNNAMIANVVGYVPVYKPTHKNHPCSIWASESSANFEWLTKLGLALSAEYTFRYNKRHKCQSIIEDFSTKIDKFISKPMTDYKLCMPDQYKVASVIESYRNYYRGDKAYIAKWTGRNAPDWWII